MPTKLTKKQKKAAAFRKRGGKGSDNVLDVPLMDELEDTKDEQDATLTAPLLASQSIRKRKREEEEIDEQSSRKKSKIQTNTVTTGSEQSQAKRPKVSPRYILFVGNLGYKTTVEDLANHFASCDPPPTIRLLTNRSKASTEDKRPEKSKGCAFLEFSKASGLQTALRFHQSVLDGRKINVELSAGGGGKSDARLKKLREKNAKFQKARSESLKRKKVPEDGHGNDKPAAKTRHSTTSGNNEIPETKKTWSIPKGGEAAGRGGQRHRRVNGRNRQDNSKPGISAWEPSGANAIPVG